MQAGKIGVVQRPVRIAITGGEGLFDRLERFRFATENAVGAGGVIERVGIVRAQSDGRFQVTNGLVRFVAVIGEIGGEQNTSANIFGNTLELLAQYVGHAFANLFGFFLASQALEGLLVGDIGVVIVAIAFHGALDQSRGVLEAAGGEKRAAENVPESVAIGFAFAGTLRHESRFGIFLLRVEKTRVRDEHLGKIGGQRRGAVAGGEAAIDPFLILLANFVIQSAEIGDARVGQGEIRVELDGLLEHLQGVLDIFAVRVVSAAKVEIVGLRILGGLARDEFFFL